MKYLLKKEDKEKTGADYKIILPEVEDKDATWQIEGTFCKAFSILLRMHSSICKEFKQPERPLEINLDKEELFPDGAKGLVRTLVEMYNGGGKLK